MRIMSIEWCVWQVKDVEYTRLCSTKSIMTVNGKFPGPTLYAHKGDTILVNVQNKARYNITIHWYVIIISFNWLLLDGEFTEY